MKDPHDPNQEEHRPEESEFIFDEEEFETPSFYRSRASGNEQAWFGTPLPPRDPSLPAPFWKQKNGKARVYAFKKKEDKEKT